MSEARRADREVINRYLRVYNRDSGDFVGYLVDITPGGAMLQSKQAIEPEQRFELRIELPEEMQGSREIVVNARSKWEKKEDNALFYHTGFEFESLTDDDTVRVRSLMEHYKIEGLAH